MPASLPYKADCRAATHVIILAGVDQAHESLDDLCFIQPLIGQKRGEQEVVTEEGVIDVSAKNKSQIIYDLLTHHNADLACIRETWLGADSSVTWAQALPAGYSVNEQIVSEPTHCTGHALNAVFCTERTHPWAEIISISALSRTDHFPVKGSQAQYLLEAELLVHVQRRLVGDEVDQLLHAGRLAQEVQQLAVLRFALLEEVIFLHQLLQRHILLLKQLVNISQKGFQGNRQGRHLKPAGALRSHGAQGQSAAVWEEPKPQGRSLARSGARALGSRTAVPRPEQRGPGAAAGPGWKQAGRARTPRRRRRRPPPPHLLLPSVRPSVRSFAFALAACFLRPRRACLRQQRPLNAASLREEGRKEGGGGVGPRTAHGRRSLTACLPPGPGTHGPRSLPPPPRSSSLAAQAPKWRTGREGGGTAHAHAPPPRGRPTSRGGLLLLVFRRQRRALLCGGTRGGSGRGGRIGAVLPLPPFPPSLPPWAMESPAGGAGPASAPRWSRLSAWLECACAVTFDLELGQALELVYPPDFALSEKEKTSICHSSFPDSYSGVLGDTQFSFRFRQSGPHRRRRCRPEEPRPQGGPQPEDQEQPTGPPALQRETAHYFGYVYFRQVKDASVKRGYFQKALVLVSRLPYVNLFQALLRLVAPEYFDKLDPCLEAVCSEIDQWPPPVPGQTLNLPVMGVVIQVQIPSRVDRPDSSPDRPLNQEKLLPAPLVLPSACEVDLFRCFQTVLIHIQMLWEWVLLGEPLVVMGPSPAVSSEVVLALTR
ncbi:uncharacterized protein LOC121930801 [Sceloporus undulatus]|uniref:uncharacterized protein LOC121930801 n=1 Tax=Sceloporus undulatus TaxID=8520 RepID=UPI001C4B8496|nr:uncharacterized protein LOC121930801 [Sceloporus undulatus]